MCVAATAFSADCIPRTLIACYDMYGNKDQHVAVPELVTSTTSVLSAVVARDVSKFAGGDANGSELQI